MQSREQQAAHMNLMSSACSTRKLNQCHLLLLRLIKKASSAISSSTPAMQPITMPAMAPPLRPPPPSVSHQYAPLVAPVIWQGGWRWVQTFASASRHN